jgi:predicted ATPase
MKIERIRIKRFKVFKDVEIRNLPDMCVFLGANSSGKSSLFDVFAFLSDALRDNITAAFNARGGFKEVVSRDQSGDIEFEITFRNDTAFLIYTLSFGLKKEQPIVTKEILTHSTGQGTQQILLDFREGRGTAIPDREEDESSIRKFHNNPEEAELDSPNILAVKGLGQFRRFKTISRLRKLAENWHISDINIHNARFKNHSGLDQRLNPSGENLASAARHIYQNHREIFNAILGKMKEKIPALSRIEPVETVDGRIVLQFHEDTFNNPFSAGHISDGILKLFAYFLLLNAPTPRPLVCMEEPETYLHPDLLPELAEEIRTYANTRGQVFISTHSPDFVNAVRIEELFCLTRGKGFTSIRSAKDDPVVNSLYQSGDLLGYLWTQQYLKGGTVH